MWFFRKNDVDFSSLEDSLIESDFGPSLTKTIIDTLQKNPKIKLRNVIKDIISGYISEIPVIFPGKKTSIMLMGVNGSGKTITSAKLANFYLNKGMTVDLAACDTFRAAAVEQLEAYATKLGINVFKANSKKQVDPASIAFEALSKTNSDILIIDTAGRLQNNTNLMDELRKISMVLKKIDDTAPNYTYLTIDATTGQSSIEQVIEFNKFCKISGIILNKVDGGAKGGTIIRIINELKIPIVAVGIGENLSDIRKFNLDKFLEGIEEF